MTLVLLALILAVELTCSKNLYAAPSPVGPAPMITIRWHLSHFLLNGAAATVALTPTKFGRKC